MNVRFATVVVVAMLLGGCSSDQGTAGDPGPVDVSVSVSTTAAGSSTPATVATTSANSATDAFNRSLETSLSGTSYSYLGQRGSDGWLISAQVYEYAAQELCRELAIGRTKSELRDEITQVETLGEADLDQDIPAYFSALYEGATTFFCPEHR